MYGTEIKLCISKGLVYMRKILITLCLVFASSVHALEWMSWETYGRDGSIYLQKKEAFQDGYSGAIGIRYRVKNKSDDDLCIRYSVSGHRIKNSLDEEWTHVRPGRSFDAGAVRRRGLEGRSNWDVGVEWYTNSDCTDI